MKKFKKPLDKRSQVWYNKDVNKGKDNPLKYKIKETDTMSKKMSYAVAITEAIEGRLSAEGVERLEALRESLAKRNSNKSGKPTKAQIANAELGEAVAAAMTAGEVYTIAEVKGLVPALAEATPQKVGPICRKLVAAGRLAESKVKGKVVYSLAE